MGAEPPPLEPLDVYLYAHGNGAIFLYHPDARSRFVVLSEALEVARDCGLAGGRVFLGGDAGKQMADHVLAAIRRTGTPVVDYVPPVKPYQWDVGGDALMVAASYGQDDLLDDLLDRGADVRATNDSGSTALHHAAGAGNLHAIDRLLAAGADPDVRNDIGLTPHMQAMVARAHTAALRLEAAGATPAHADDTEASFRRIHWLPRFGHVPGTLIWAFFGAQLAWPPTFPVRLVTAIVVGGLVALQAAPTRALWTAAVPRRLEGPRLQLRTFLGRPVDLDLDTVTAAAFGTSGGLAGRLGGTKVVLVHPGGAPYRRRSLRSKALLGPKEAELLPEEGRATVMVLDSWWQHDVLRPVGNRLISGSAALTPLLQYFLKQARLADPKKKINLRGRRLRR